MGNGTLLQAFHWYTPGDSHLWPELAHLAQDFKEKGINAVWLPPAYKGANGGYSVGYDVYDLFDLGEFDQKGSLPTKYGTKKQYLNAIQALHDQGIRVYVDTVLNHKMGGDATELVKMVRVDPNDRNRQISEPFEAEAYTKFYFPVRNNRYSDFVWDFQCFSGIDHIKGEDGEGIFKILNQYGDHWEENVSDENGNYDYLMGADLDFRNPAVVDHLKYWIKWYHDTTRFDGLRLDAVKHINADFFKTWIDYVRQEVLPDCFIVGEYWTPDMAVLEQYIDTMDGRMHLFDAPLQNNFHNASKQGQDYNLTEILDNSLLQSHPDLAVTIVANHDTQPLQALENPVEPWFKPLAYALILMRREGYPCLFFPDIYGTAYTDKGEDGQDHEIYMPGIDKINELIYARQQFAYGDQIDYMDHPNCIAWQRTGDENHDGCITILSNGEEGFKEMTLGAGFSDAVFYDFLKNRDDEITLDAEGKGTFFVNGGSVSVWVRKK